MSSFFFLFPGVFLQKTYCSLSVHKTTARELVFTPACLLDTVSITGPQVSGCDTMDRSRLFTTLCQKCTHITLRVTVHSSIYPGHAAKNGFHAFEIKLFFLPSLSFSLSSSLSFCSPSLAFHLWGFVLKTVLKACGLKSEWMPLLVNCP